MRPDVLAVALLAWPATVAGQGACFVPNGTNRHALTNAKDYKYEPCEDNGHSMCCNTVSGDKCQPNGLCWNEGGRLTWRESCTDPTWQSPKCLKLCIHDEVCKFSQRACCLDLLVICRFSEKGATDGVSSSGTDVLVTKCADGSYCCGNDKNASACCNEGRGVRIVDGEVVTSTSRRIGPATSAAASTIPSSPAFAPSPTPGGSEGSSNAAIIGGAVGGAVGAVLLASAVGFLFWYRRKRTAAAEGRMREVVAGGYVVGETGKDGPEMRYYAEPSELPGNERLPVELGGEPVPPDRR
ncbi:hypothetical protein CMUS01_02277 [Colletotrichum musicola]|uniref:Uncharacterized protein n=1 Tax=Colletotrichum musicola TaxID=2175873 RepID=A0A8H6NVL0_9PEZI|nr:hypothetical protein CMUS01_02277 [Colletotrichum musicola]